MSWYDLVKPILFAFDAETIHERGLEAIARGWVSGRRYEDPKLRTHAFGRELANPIGLAAGFDKNAVAVDRWAEFGFGFIEIGTVTRHAQPGNPRPRLFRLPKHQAIINRMGFNNDGADVVAERLGRRTSTIPLGVNLGKSKITPLEEAASDYAYSFSRLRPYADYVVVNVSSPNTPGLRSLQDRDPLRRILLALRELDADVPLLVKIAPDLTDEAIDDVVAVAIEAQLTGVIATNTTLQRPDVVSAETGGLSGAPLTKLAERVTQKLKTRLPAGMMLIGVGGIMNGQDAVRRLRAGADLIQVYSGWVYGGPDFIADLLTDLVEMREAQSGAITSMG
jgi:dihydroorotate dehydrogenase